MKTEKELQKALEEVRLLIHTREEYMDSHECQPEDWEMAIIKVIDVALEKAKGKSQ